MREKKGQPDRMLFYITLLLLTIGLIMVLSSSSYQAMLENKDAYYFFKRQFIFAGLGLAAMFIMMYIRPELIERLAFPTIVVVVIMLLWYRLSASRSKAPDAGWERRICVFAG